MLKAWTTSGKEAMKEIKAANSWGCRIDQWRKEPGIESKQRHQSEKNKGE